MRRLTVPNKQSGNDMKIHPIRTMRIVPNGTAASEWYPMAMELSTKAMLRHIVGKSVAVSSMVRIHVLPSFRE